MELVLVMHYPVLRRTKGNRNMPDKPQPDLLAKAVQRVVQERLTPKVPVKVPPKPAG